MTVMPARPHRVAIVGGGFSGTLLALRLATARPDWTIILTESRSQAGRGLAYGACEPQHLLNVPVSRMEVGLQPAFADWLRSRPGFLGRSIGRKRRHPGGSFRSQATFGDYMEQRLADALVAGNIRRIHGEAISIEERHAKSCWPMAPLCRWTVWCWQPATCRPLFHSTPMPRIGLSPIPGSPTHWIASRRMRPCCCWVRALTMIDMLLRCGGGVTRVLSKLFPAMALLPRHHRLGGSWPAFLDPDMTPREAFRAVRVNVARAESRGVPWQRVFDAARPFVPTLWHGWSLGQRTQFLRHLRTLWDVHRHRMATRISRAVNDLLSNGILTVTAGRVLAIDEYKGRLTAMIRPPR